METEIILPRLVLGYYFWISFFILLTAGGAKLIIRKFRPGTKMLQKAAGKLSLLAGSYMIATLCWKGGNFASHALQEDMIKILSTGIVIFMVSLALEKLVSVREER